MAPEILRGEKYEEASDVYSFGIVLVELLTGEIPYKGLSLPQISGLVGYNENYSVGDRSKTLVGNTRQYSASRA
jgi:serine/threonine protein kinase